MAKIIYFCPRDPQKSYDFETRINLLNRRIIPDNIIPNPPLILHHDGIWVGLLNPTGEILRKEASACIGFPVFVPPDWWKPGGGDPDGSYGLFRGDEFFVEVCTDISATRTIWFCQTDKFFIASSSQRAIVAFLGNFQVNKKTYPFMLASGLLGQNNSWDCRINHLEADEHLILDRKTWLISRRQTDFKTSIGKQTREEYKDQMRKALWDIFNDHHFDTNKWFLSLSGGVDSRGTLAFLGKRPGIRCITWGTSDTIANPRSDGRIAKEVADLLGAHHEFLETDSTKELDGSVILNRFVEAGEGRVDQLGGYRDGCLIWKKLFENGYSGYIRGDEFMGLKHLPGTEKGVLLDMNFFFLEDYANMPSCRELGLPEQVMAEKYHRRAGESLYDWASRLRFSIKKVIEVAALNEIKNNFMEVMTPLISRSVINLIKTIPYEMNKGKSIYYELVEELVPGVGYADPSDQSIEEIIREPMFKAAIKTELESENARKWLPKELIKLLLANLDQSGAGTPSKPLQQLRRTLKKKAPWLSILAGFFPRKIFLDGQLVAFRGFIISRSCSIFSKDAELFHHLEKK